MRVFNRAGTFPLTFPFPFCSVTSALIFFRSRSHSVPKRSVPTCSVRNPFIPGQATLKAGGKGRRASEHTVKNFHAAGAASANFPYLGCNFREKFCWYPVACLFHTRRKMWRRTEKTGFYIFFCSRSVPFLNGPFGSKPFRSFPALVFKVDIFPLAGFLQFLKNFYSQSHGVACSEHHSNISNIVCG